MSATPASMETDTNNDDDELRFEEAEDEDAEPSTEDAETPPSTEDVAKLKHEKGSGRTVMEARWERMRATG